MLVAPQGALERVPLPWFLKKRFLDAYLRDVHHYLFDVEFGPPGKPAVHIQQTIRKRFVDAVARRAGGRVFTPDIARLGEYVVADYLRTRRGRRAARQRPNRARLRKESTAVPLKVAREELPALNLTPNDVIKALHEHPAIREAAGGHQLV